MIDGPGMPQRHQHIIKLITACHRIGVCRSGIRGKVLDGADAAMLSAKSNPRKNPNVNVRMQQRITSLKVGSGLSLLR
jgi:hypothetical protein